MPWPQPGLMQGVLNLCLGPDNNTNDTRHLPCPATIPAAKALHSHAPVGALHSGQHKAIISSSVQRDTQAQRGPVTRPVRHSRSEGWTEGRSLLLHLTALSPGWRQAPAPPNLLCPSPNQRPLPGTRRLLPSAVAGIRSLLRPSLPPRPDSLPDILQGRATRPLPAQRGVLGTTALGAEGGSWQAQRSPSFSHSSVQKWQASVRPQIPGPPSSGLVWTRERASCRVDGLSDSASGVPQFEKRCAHLGGPGVDLDAMLT